jgi:hypothetical protein
MSTPRPSRRRHSHRRVGLARTAAAWRCLALLTSATTAVLALASYWPSCRSIAPAEEVRRHG